MTVTIRPLVRVAPGHWRSRDGRCTFMRHTSDPHPQRWYAYLEDDVDEPINDGLGHTSLREVAEWAERISVCPYCDEVAVYLHDEITHMEKVHPDVIAQRLYEAGLEPPDR